MDKNDVRARDRLAVLWENGTRPAHDQALVDKAYRRIFLPALETDINRLMSIWAASVRKKNAVNFGHYRNALCDTKKAAGRLAMAKLPAFDATLSNLTVRYAARDLYGIERVCADLVNTYAWDALPEDNPAYADARRACIAYDTSDALDAFAGCLTESFQFRAELYDARLADPQNGEKDRIRAWIDARRAQDTAAIRDEMDWLLVAPELAVRRALAEATHHTKPAENDYEADLRQHNIRLVPPRAA